MNENQILMSVISRLDEVPRPRDGKSALTWAYVRDMQEAFKYVRQVQYSQDVREMRENYEVFNRKIQEIIDKTNF